MILTAESVKRLNEIVHDLKSRGAVVESIGTAEVPVSAIIESVNVHATKRMAERGISTTEAQAYIDNAMVMFVQNEGARRLYISFDGNSVLLVEGNTLISAYSSDYFDDGIKAIIAEVKKLG